MGLKEAWSKSISCLVMSDSLWPHGLWPARFLSHWNSLGKNTGVGSHSLLQEIFPTQGLNMGLPNCRRTLYCLSLQGSPQFSSVTQSCPTLCDTMNRSTPGLPVHNQLLESIQTHVHWVGDAIQPSYPLLSPSPLALNLSQHQGLFKWVSSSLQVAKVLEFQFQQQSFQRTPRTDLF